MLRRRVGGFALRTVALAFVGALGAEGWASSYAVIFSGGRAPVANEPRFYWDTVRIYEALINGWGYRPECVTVLFADGQSPSEDQLRRDAEGNVYLVDSQPDLNGDGTLDVAASPAKASALRATLISYSATVTPEDTFLLWVSDHGGQTPRDDGYDEFIWGWGTEERIYDWELAQWVRGLHARVETYVFGFCYSGGFIAEMSRPGRVIMAAAQADELAWGHWGTPSSPETDYVDFPHAWYDAITDGTGDVNGDGFVSLEESFVWARDHDYYYAQGREHPVWDDPSAIGAYYTLVGAVPEPATVTLLVVGAALMGLGRRRHSLPR